MVGLKPANSLIFCDHGTAGGPTERRSRAPVAEGGAGRAARRGDRGRHRDFLAVPGTVPPADSGNSPRLRGSPRNCFGSELRRHVPPGRSPPFKRKSFIGGRGRCRDGSRSSGCRGALGRPPFLVEQEVGLHEFPVTACHVSCREHRAQVVDVRVTVGRFPAIRQQVPVDVVRQIDVSDPSGIGTGVAVVAELRETTDSEEPAIRQEEEVVFREPVHQLPFLRDPP